jgi:hypothetical protein
MVFPEVRICVEEGVIEERVAFVDPEESYWIVYVPMG